MKINNWRRKLASALVAGGLLLPSVVYAAALDTNLVVNGDFENVNVNVTGAYGGPLVLGWTGINLFAYSHDGSITSTSNQTTGVPDYAEGADPPVAGHWYFTPNNTGVVDPTDVRLPGEYFQDISVGSGPSGATIAAGYGHFAIFAYMSSYLSDTDVGHITAEFRDGVGASLASVQMDDSDSGPDNVWNLNSLVGRIPIGTTTVRLSLWATRTGGGGGGDGYMDNIFFTVHSDVPEPASVVMAGLGFAALGLGIGRRRGKA